MYCYLLSVGVPKPTIITTIILVCTIWFCTADAGILSLPKNYTGIHSAEEQVCVVEHGQMVAVNVDSFGALGDGYSDDTQAFVSAWKTACSIPNSVFLVPEEKSYLVKPYKFRGPCQDGGIVIHIAGTLMAPDDPTTWDPHSPRNWLVFSDLNGATIQGGGIIDGSGHNWWAQSCKINKTNPCRSAPTALTIDSSLNVRITNLRFQNSQQMHIVIARCTGVEVSDLQVVAPQNSPNTDGIHITSSQNVLVERCSIATGDDCISIVTGSGNIKITEVLCGPGHGISIGSLGKDKSVGYVSGIMVEETTLTGTTNGLRIKTWQGGSGFVHGIRFQNILMNSVANPIIINQFYCDSSTPCENQTSAVRVSEVIYENVKGTSTTQHAMQFACSDSIACENIILSNVDIRRESGDSADLLCNNAIGYGLGYINPSADCLLSHQTQDDQHVHSILDCSALSCFL
ncbi:hypothetical protein SUGI_0126300 [Cryptomeria japonica]|nr:hypothetical protein SUGI_0126300 [Cryptomeria japonica]